MTILLSEWSHFIFLQVSYRCGHLYRKTSRLAVVGGPIAAASRARAKKNQQSQDNDKVTHKNNIFVWGLLARRSVDKQATINIKNQTNGT
jgi:hypothetical protein